MKNKLLVLLISGLLIAGMAGSAMATGARLLNQDGTAALPNTVDMKSGDEVIASYLINGIPNDVSRTFGYPYTGTNKIPATVNVLSGSGTKNDISVYWIQHSQFTINPADLFNLDTTVNPAEGSYKDIGNIKIVLNSAPEAVGSRYSVLVPVGELSPDPIEVVASASVKVKNVPEFPTVAAPVAGVLGLLFIFGRKKGDL